jgi:DNA-binding response OmpR family regulator
LIKGADYYLVKPININDLKAKIVKSLEKSKIQRRLMSTKIANLVLMFLIPIWIIAGILLARLLD